jgi:hypothetical protein
MDQPPRRDFTTAELEGLRWYDLPTGVDLDPVEASWLAALIDGEGTIGIGREVRPANVSGYKYRSIIGIYNSHLPLVQKVASLIPGALNALTEARARAGNWKTVYRFTVPAQHQLELIDAVSPYLIVKYRQAQIVRRMCQMSREVTNRGAAANHEIYERMYMEMKALNKRGI